MDDLNDDGLFDLAAGGRAGYVVYGTSSTTPVDATTPSGDRGYRIDGDGTDLAVFEVGDSDFDGLPDLLVGKPDGAGLSALVFGSEHTRAVALGNLGGDQGQTLLPSVEDSALGASASPAGRATDRNASDFIVGSPGASPAGRTGAGSAYVVPGDARQGCGDNYVPEADESSALVTCLEGERMVAVDMDRDAEPDRVKEVPRAQRTGTARRRSSRPRNIRAEGDTSPRGKFRDKYRWYMFRTGVTYEINSRGEVKEIQRVRLHVKLTLRGNIAVLLVFL